MNSGTAAGRTGVSRSSSASPGFGSTEPPRTHSKLCGHLVATLVGSASQRLGVVALLLALPRKPTGFPSFSNHAVCLNIHRRPNPSLKRTRAGMPFQALISFWAFHVLPARAA